MTKILFVCHENIKTVFHELFDEALKRYNDKQTRADRKIEDYYEKIRSSKQESRSMKSSCKWATRTI